jgi:hypothetical protein
MTGPRHVGKRSQQHEHKPCDGNLDGHAEPR